MKIIAFLAVILSVAIMTSYTALIVPDQTEQDKTPVSAQNEIVPVPPRVVETEPKRQIRYIVEEADVSELDEQPELLKPWREDVPLPAELQAALLAICEENRVDPLLALGLIETESNFQPDIVSPWGDYGLCQLNHLYFPTDLTPEQNMAAGIGLLAANLRRYGTIEAALTAYNRGHDDGTRSYASVVLRNAEKWGYDNG